MSKSKKLPTDLKLLQCIYEMYESEYAKVIPGQDRVENDPYVPIKINEVAAKLDTREELIFGRLFFHLNRKYNYKMDSGTPVELFVQQISGGKLPTPQRDVIQFPFLTSILAELKNEYFKFSLPVVISSVFSFLAFVISALALFKGCS